MIQINFVLTNSNVPQLQEYHCMRCTRLFFRANRDLLALWIGDEYPEEQIPKGMGWVQHKCRGCETMYNIYFQ